MTKLLARAFITMCCLFPTIAISAEEGGAFRDPEVVRAAFAIGMNLEQGAQFREVVTEFGTSLGTEFRKLLQRGNVDIERRWERKQKQLTRKMDEKMATFLTEQQIPAYETYRDVLLLKLEEQAAARRAAR